MVKSDVGQYIKYTEIPALQAELKGAKAEIEQHKKLTNHACENAGKSRKLLLEAQSALTASQEREAKLREILESHLPIAEKLSSVQDKLNEALASDEKKDKCEGVE
jgi:hypothetical protein